MSTPSSERTIVVHTPPFKKQQASLTPIRPYARDHDDADTDALFVFLQSFLILFIDTSVVRLLVAFRLALAFAAASSSTESAENRLEGVFDGGRSYGSALSGNP